MLFGGLPHATCHMPLASCPYPGGVPLRGAGAGSRPGGRGTFLCLAKEKYPKERRADVRAASRFPALLAPGGVSLNSLRSDNASPDPPGAVLLGPADGKTGIRAGLPWHWGKRVAGVALGLALFLSSALCPLAFVFWFVALPLRGAGVRVSARRPRYFSLPCQRKVPKRKARRRQGRCAVPCAARAGRDLAKLASLKQREP